MLWKIHGTNSIIENSRVVLTSNVKMDQCCPQLRFFILMVRLYNNKLSLLIRSLILHRVILLQRRLRLTRVLYGN
jgi:hypothetical protein